MKKESLWYLLMSSIFGIVTIASVIYVFDLAAQRELNFPNHLLLIGIGLGIWSIFLWRRKSYPFAFVLSLFSGYSLLLVVFTMMAM
ncbi:hypothetical protein [Alteribacter populi]|uniref:hypothetical protein n=1 Tax=Alteribacter populi TaxID=2011011 RepID=UPI000BBAF6D9|nr:hypothetical protein [Alteribacter populi]